MKITLPRATLAKALDTANRIVERRNTIPILSNVLLRVENATLRVSATDLDMTAAITVDDVTVAAPGAVTVSSATLHDLIRKLASDAVSLDASEDGKMAVRGGRARFSLLTLPESDWPDMPAGERSYAFALPAPTLARALEKTDFAISTEETRYYLNGVFMHRTTIDAAPMLAFVATDGHRLGRLTLAEPEGTLDPLAGVIIPRKAVKELRNILKGGEGEVVIEGDGQKIRFTLGATSLLTKLIDGSFPDYARVIPTMNEKIAKFTREHMIAATDRVATVISERGRAVKLEFDADKLTLSVTNADVGSASEELEGDYASGPLEVGFNATYLREVLAALTGASVEIALNDSNSPTIFTSSGDPDMLAVLMPMRV